jgi:hypothetical protein
MLQKILDTTKIYTSCKDKIEYSLVMIELEQDLKRFDSKFPEILERNTPKNSNAYLIKILPSTKTFSPKHHRFIFYLEYGNLKNGIFNLLEKIEIEGKEYLQSETLPMI